MGESRSVRLTTKETPRLQEDWDRVMRDYGGDGASFFRRFAELVVEFEGRHKRLPKLKSLRIAEANHEGKKSD